MPFHSAFLTRGEWKVAALHGKISKTWSTIPDVSCVIERQRLDEDEKSIIVLKINHQRLEKISEMMGKLREELGNKLKELKEAPESWVKFGGTGGASRKITLGPNVKIIFSSNLQELFGMDHQEYFNQEDESALSITVGRDYLNLKKYNVLYAMCSDVQGVYANNKVMGILTDITADSTLIGVGDSIEFTNQNPIYHKWVGGSKDKIEAYFANSNGDVLQMDEGYTFIFLHFVKVR